MESATVSNKNTRLAKSKGESALKLIFNIIFLLAIICVFLWNWDDFWQTDIRPIKNFQQQYFPKKYTDENLKMSRVFRNNEIIERIEQRISKYEDLVRDAESKESEAKEALSNYLKQENEKCEYYKTSLLIIKNISRKISSDDLSQLVRCTNNECSEIINSTPKALSLCD